VKIDFKKKKEIQHIDEQLENVTKEEKPELIVMKLALQEDIILLQNEHQPSKMDNVRSVIK
jgi:hypothetical protein